MKSKNTPLLTQVTRGGFITTVLAAVPVLALSLYALSPTEAAVDSDICVTAERVDNQQIVSKRGFCPVATPTPTPASVGSNASVTNVQNTAADANGSTTIVTSIDGTKLAAHTGKKAFVSSNAGQSWKLIVDISTSIAGVDRFLSTMTTSADGTNVVIGPGNSGSAETLYIYKANLVTQNYSGGYGLDYGDVGTFLAMDSSDDGRKLVALRSDGYVWRSTNLGSSWVKGQNIGASGYGGINKVAASADGTKLVASGGTGVWNSTDSGVTWKKLTQVSQKWTSLDSNAAGTKWFATVQAGKTFYSTDMGATWIPYEILGTAANWSNVSTSSDGQVVIVGQNITNGQLFISKDGGETWNTSPTLGAGRWTMAKVSPDGKRFFAQNGSVLKTGTIE